MSSKLRIKGRILINGNITLLTLVLCCFIGIISFTNLSVFFYETALLEKVKNFSGRYETLLNFAVAVILNLLTFGIYSAIKLGTDRFFLRRAQKKGASAIDIFYYFHPLRAVGAFSFMLKLTSVKLGALLFSLLPFLASLAFVIYLLNSGVSAAVLFFLLLGSVAFLTSGVVFFKRTTDSLFLAKYYFLEGKYLSFSHIISSSQQDMKDKTALLRKIRAGFSGWFSLCILILPIGYVWSYYNQTLAVASENFMKD